jgi:hypothetical protein
VQRQSEPIATLPARQGLPSPSGPPPNGPSHQANLSQSFNPATSPLSPQHDRSYSQGPSQAYNTMSPTTPTHYNSASVGSTGAPQLSSLPFQTEKHAPTSPPAQPLNQSPHPNLANAGHLPPIKPVFGLSLEELFARDGSAVPMIVYQCIQAVDLYGLEVEGIYRLSGTASHVTKIRAMFDNGEDHSPILNAPRKFFSQTVDASNVDFRNPENFFHDVNSVAGLLKQFFRDLPDPLFTAEHYNAFIDAASEFLAWAFSCTADTHFRNR